MQRAEPLFGPSQVAVMPEPAEHRRSKARLLRIDFPRVEVEDRRRLLDGVQPRDAPARPLVGKDAKVAAAADREVERAPSDGRAGASTSAPPRCNRYGCRGEIGMP